MGWHHTTALLFSFYIYENCLFVTRTFALYSKFYLKFQVDTAYRRGLKNIITRERNLRGYFNVGSLELQHVNIGRTVGVFFISSSQFVEVMLSK